jgi:hypothetical protein
MSSILIPNGNTAPEVYEQEQPGKKSDATTEQPECSGWIDWRSLAQRYAFEVHSVDKKVLDPVIPFKVLTCGDHYLYVRSAERRGNMTIIHGGEYSGAFVHVWIAPFHHYELALERIEGSNIGIGMVKVYDKGLDSETDPLDLIAILNDTKIDGVVQSVTAKDLASLIRSNAAEALIAASKRQDIEPLIAALRDQNKGVRCIAAGLLGGLKDPRAVDYLVTALRDEDDGVRFNAAAALRKIGDPRAVKPLADVLAPLIAALRKKSSDGVRSYAAEALGKIGDPRAVEPLIAALKGKLGQNAPYSARRALKKISGQDYGHNRGKWQKWWNQHKSELLKQ